MNSEASPQSSGEAHDLCATSVLVSAPVSAAVSAGLGSIGTSPPAAWSTAASPALADTSPSPDTPIPAGSFVPDADGGGAAADGDASSCAVGELLFPATKTIEGVTGSRSFGGYLWIQSFHGLARASFAG